VDAHELDRDLRSLERRAEEVFAAAVCTDDDETYAFVRALEPYLKRWGTYVPPLRVTVKESDGSIRELSTFEIQSVVSHWRHVGHLDENENLEWDVYSCTFRGPNGLLELQYDYLLKRATIRSKRCAS